MSCLLMYLVVIFSLSPLAVCESSLAEEFFVAFPRSSHGRKVLSIYITTPHTEPVLVAVSTLRRYYNTFTTARAGTTREINPPKSLELQSGVDHEKGIWIHTVSPGKRISVSVMKYTQGSYLSDAYLALPPVIYQGLREYVYYVSSYRWAQRVSAVYNSTMVLVGGFPNTSVTITPSQQIEIPAFFLSSSYPSQRVLNAGESYTITLHKMQTLHVESRIDLTGTKIVSSKPLTVLGSHECVDIPVNVGFCDFIVEQFLPTVTWGRFFILASLHSRRTGERYRMVAKDSHTRVRVKCVEENSSDHELGHIMMLMNSSGEVKEFELGRDRFCSVLASKPILLVQYSLGYSLDNIGDPFMLVIPPVVQYSNNYSLMAPEHFSSHMTILVPLEHYNASKVLLNGTRLGNWSAVYCTDSMICGYGTRLAVPKGTHNIRHADIDGRLVVMMYGFEYHDGYGLKAGMELNQIADVCMHGDIRLDSTVSSDKLTGRVKICQDGVWTSVCGDLFTSSEAAVVCRQLGYSPHGSVAYSMSSNRTSSWPSIAGNVHCMGTELTLMECSHDFDIAACSSDHQALVKCYPNYNITVHASLPVGPHLTHSPATITCRAVLDGVMEDGLTMHMTWSKEDRLIADADCHHEVVPRPLAPEVGNADEGHMEFVSNMTMRELKPHDNGTYGCSAALVSYSTGQRVSMEVNSSTLMSIVDSGYELFQLRFVGVGVCGAWLVQHESPTEKLSQVKEALVEHLRRACAYQCSITTNHISGAAFRCFQRDADRITFRARIHATSEANVTVLIGHLKECLRHGGTVLSISGLLLSVDGSCELVINSFSDNECDGGGGGLVETTAMASFPTDTSLREHSSTTDHGRFVPTTATTTPGVTSKNIAETKSSTASTTPTTHKRHDPSSAPTSNGSCGNAGLTLQASQHSQTSSSQFNVYIIVGSVVFVSTLLILSVVCAAVIISCLKYSRRGPVNNVVSVTSPFPMAVCEDATDFDDPVSENLEKSKKSSEEESLKVVLKQ